MKYHLVFTILLLLCLNQDLKSQFNAYALELKCSEDLHEIMDFDAQQYEDSIGIKNDLRKIIHELQERSYFEASVDSLYRKDSVFTAQLHLGKKYKGFRIKYDQGVKQVHYSKLKDLQELKTRLLEEKMDNGYPFAMVKFENLKLVEEVLEADIVVDENQRVLFDEIKIIGEAKLGSKFLSNFLDIKKGEPYDQSLVDEVQRKLKQLNFLQVKSAPKLRFDKEGVDVYVFIEKRKASRFDLLLGLLPVNDPFLDRNLIVTSLGLIDLNNIFENGENIYAKFEQLKPLTQELDLKFTWPFLLNTPLGFKSSGSFYKQDTAFIDLEYEIGLRYFLKGSDYLEVYLQNSSTNVLSLKESNIIATKTLPNILDRKNNAIGFGLSLNNLDYLYNPSKGFSIFARATFGKKTIPKDNDILDLRDPLDPEFSFGQLYDDLKLSQDQFEFELTANYFFKLGKSSALKTSFQVGGIYSSGQLLSNEQFRLGGAKRLRGFNEQSFFADQYYLGSLEYRLLLSRNTYGFVFMDLAQLEDNVLMGAVSKRPLGFGAGFSFDTNTGIFNISLALGKDLLNPDDFFDLSEPKIHLGYISLF